MSRRKIQRGKESKLTVTYQNGVQTGAPRPQSRTDKDITGKTTHYIRVRSTTPTRGGR